VGSVGLLYEGRLGVYWVMFGFDVEFCWIEYDVDEVVVCY